MHTNGFLFKKTFDEFSDLIFVQLKRQLVKAVFDSNPYLRGQKRSNEVAKKSNHRHGFGNRPNPYAEGENLKSIVKKSGPRFIQA
ncbi:hypothetical protein ACTXT7_012480 [Hymenolepis weldensis]